MLAPLQQVGQWMAQKAQSLPAKAGQSNMALPPQAGEGQAQPFDGSMNLVAPSLPDALAQDAFQTERGFSPMPEARLLETGLKNGLKNGKPLLDSLKDSLLRNPSLERWTQKLSVYKLPFKKAESQQVEAVLEPQGSQQGLVVPGEQTAETSLTEKITQKFRKNRRPLPEPKPTPENKPSGLRSREDVMRGFPVLYRDLKTVPRFSISPEEIAVSPVHDRLRALEEDVLAEPWDSEHLFTPFLTGH